MPATVPYEPRALSAAWQRRHGTPVRDDRFCRLSRGALQIQLAGSQPGGEVLGRRLGPAPPSRWFEVAGKYLHQCGGRFGVVDVGVVAGRYDEPGGPAMSVLEQKDGDDRPGGESLLILDRKLDLLALDEAWQDAAHRLLDLARPPTVA